MKKSLRKYFEKAVGQYLNLWGYFSPQKASEKTLELFAKPRRGRLNPEQKHFLESSIRQKIEVQGLKIQTYFWKGGPLKVLLVHGWESNTARWKNIIQLLQKNNYSIIGVDAPAHGDSEGEEFSVPIYVEALSKLAQTYQPEFIMGHSLGGASILFQQSQQAFPNLQKMVLLAPPSELTEIMATFQKRLGLNAKTMERFEQTFEEKFNYNFSDFSMLKLTKKFDIRALYIHDKKDKVVNWKESEAVVRQWPKAKLILTEGFGHGLHDKAVNKMIIDYLKEEN